MIAARLFVITLLLLYPFFSRGQNTIGLPDIVCYPKAAYGAGAQNWDIKQDANGILYFANNEGMLSFDGTYWKLYPVSNKTIVRSLEMGNDHRIYVGAQGELGYFSPDPNGRLTYHSLKTLLPEKDRSFADVWDIVSYNGDIFFRTINSIFQYSDGQMTVFNAPSWLYLGIANGKLVAEDYKSELFFFRKGNWVAFEGSSGLPKEFLMTGFLSLGKSRELIATLKHGVFVLQNDTIRPLASPALAHIASQRIYAVASAGNHQLALATVLEGCFIVDEEGNLVQQISREEGLQNNNILSIFADQQNNLWVGLDNGIDLIAYNQNIKHIYPQNQSESSGYAAIVYQNELFIGCSNGLYKVPLSNMQDLSFVKGSLLPVGDIKGQVWNLSEVNGQLLMGHHEGAYFIKNGQASLFDKHAGFWTFLPLSNVLPSPMMVSGNYQGLSFYRYDAGSFTPAYDVNFESARFTTLVPGNAIWVAHPYKGLYRIPLSATNEKPAIKLYGEQQNIKGVNYTTLYKHKLLAATEQGVFEYLPEKDSFVVAAFFKSLFGNMSIRYLKEDADGNIWFIHEKRMGVIDMSSGQPTVLYIPELDSKLVSGFEFIYPFNSHNVFVGAEKGFYLINYARYRKSRPQLRAQIRQVSIRGKGDSLLYGGYYNEVNQQQNQPDSTIRSISHRWNSLHIEYAANLYGHTASMEYSYLLKGFDAGWSEWNHKTEKDYTNLPAGNYEFQVKARNNLGMESPITSYRFTILPPWYQTIWAYLLYALLLGLLMYLVYYRQKRKLLLQQQQHAEEQKRLQYLHQLEMEKNEKELVKLRNEKLEAEIAHKNSQLASTAMHLVQKGELLSKVKEDLSKQLKKTDPEKNGDELKRVVKVLGEDERMDKDWENFAQHFDKVHSDFLVALKAKHPTLSANELKLCAYLRMNLSSKEIAPLINISVRGVEISRYRLRKKLAIATELSLFDYLMTVKAGD